jgi:hypothetical protein
MILDLEIVKQEIGGIRSIGQDTSHLGGGQHHNIGSLSGKPGVGGDGINKIKLRAADFKDLVITTSPQATANR